MDEWHRLVGNSVGNLLFLARGLLLAQSSSVDWMSDNYWFPRKRFGWGPPRNLQGWSFLISWIVLLVSGARFLPGLSGIAFLVGMVALLGLIIYFRGEPPERES